MRGAENLFQVQLLKLRPSSSSSSPSSPLFFFFLIFGCRRTAWSLEMARSRGKSWLRRVASGEKREPWALDEVPTQNNVVLGWSFIFLKIRRPQNNVVLRFMI